MAPNYFRFVRVDEAAGGGGTWSLWSYGTRTSPAKALEGIPSSLYTGSSAHTAPQSPAVNIMYAGHGIIVTNEADKDNATDDTQYISIWEEDESADLRISSRWNHTSSDGTAGNGFNFAAYVGTGQGPGEMSYHNAAYDKENDVVYFIGTTGSTRGTDFDDTSIHNPVLFKATRTGGSGNNFNSGLTQIGYISSSFSNEGAGRNHRSHRIIRVCNDELITLCDENGSFGAYGTRNGNTDGGGEIVVSNKSTGEKIESFWAGRVAITGSSGSLKYLTGYQNDSYIGSVMAVDYNQNYLTLGKIYDDPNSTNMRSGFVIFKSGSDGYEVSGQITGSVDSATDSDAWALAVDGVSFNDDYFVFGRPNAESSAGIIEVHKKTSADWASSELVLTLSGTQAQQDVEDAGLVEYQNANRFGTNVRINNNGDLMIAQPLFYRNQSDGSYANWDKAWGAIYIYTKDSGADTWTFNAFVTGSSYHNLSNQHKTDNGSFVGYHPIWLGDNNTAVFGHSTWRDTSPNYIEPGHNIAILKKE